MVWLWHCWRNKVLLRIAKTKKSISIISSIWLNKTWRESWNWRPTDATDITTSRDPYLGNPLPVFLSQLTYVSSHQYQKHCAPQNISCFSLLNSSYQTIVSLILRLLTPLWGDKEKVEAKLSDFLIIKLVGNDWLSFHPVYYTLKLLWSRAEESAVAR